MISIGALIITGGAIFGGIKACRRFSRKTAPLVWLRVPRAPLGDVRVTVGPETLSSTAHVAESDAKPSCVRHYLVQDARGRDLSILSLTSTTALIHVILGLQSSIPLFVWNGVGFGGMLAGRYLVPQLAPYRNQVDDGLMAYTGTTMVAYFVVRGTAGLTYPLGMFTQLVEGAMMGLLWCREEEGDGVD